MKKYIFIIFFIMASPLCFGGEILNSGEGSDSVLKKVESQEKSSQICEGSRCPACCTGCGTDKQDCSKCKPSKQLEKLDKKKEEKV
mgnify:CR=1 FL=1